MVQFVEPAFRRHGRRGKIADATGVSTWGPGPFEPHHYLELSWYAIHPVELLYTIMGTGCESVTRIPARMRTSSRARGKMGASAR